MTKKETRTVLRLLFLAAALVLAIVLAVEGCMTIFGKKKVQA